MAWTDLTSPAVADDLAALREAPGGERLVGIRHQVHDEPDPDWLLRPDVVRGLAAVGRAGLAYDLLVRARELPAAFEAAQALPDLRFVIDHLAKPPIRERAISPWSERLGLFSPLSNVACKLSGLVTEADWAAWRPAISRRTSTARSRCSGRIACCSARTGRCRLLAAPYERVVETARTLLAGLSAGEQAAVMGGTAVEVYGLRVG